ncbi:hypothetical protein [Puniceibacterium confluentis]|uniref:hypothetical protein n=1 Tax=Puniceibacterium confluentis TaxID=1958944 RepID=UPI0011B7A444|nr:hypothetical protein [Puniceibacterium confluentis]
MQFSVLPPWAAPLSTGHPFGLPDVNSRTKSVTHVPAVTQQSFGDTGSTQEKSPTRFWKPVGGKGDDQHHVAPPSIIQLKISEMLDRQAQRLSGPDGTQDAEPVPRTDNAEETAALLPPGPWSAGPAPEQPAAAPVTGYGQLSALSRDEGPSREKTQSDASA